MCVAERFACARPDVEHNIKMSKILKCEDVVLILAPLKGRLKVNARVYGQYKNSGHGGFPKVW